MKQQLLSIINVVTFGRLAKPLEKIIPPTEEQIQARKALDILVKRVESGEFIYENGKHLNKIHFDDMTIYEGGKIYNSKSNLYTYPYECIKPEFEQRVFKLAVKIAVIKLNRVHINKIINGEFSDK